MEKKGEFITEHFSNRQLLQKEQNQEKEIFPW